MDYHVLVHADGTRKDRVAGNLATLQGCPVDVSPLARGEIRFERLHLKGMQE